METTSGSGSSRTVDGGNGTLTQMFAEFDAYSEKVPLKLIKQRVEALTLSPKDVASYMHFDDACYKRNIIHEGPGYTALLLCWKSGQKSPIHNHKGSSCVVRVIQG